MSLDRPLSRPLAVILVVLVQVGCVFCGSVREVRAAEVAAASWKFGVLADTQWSGADDGQSPNSIPAGIIKQINKEFIRHGVRFVVAVGDTVNTSTADNIAVRALYAQDLYNARVGFYPLRGNHEASWAGPTGSGPEFQRVFPQTRDGVNNATPASAAGLGLGARIAPDPKTNPDTFVVGTHFSSPALTYHGVSKAGLSYSFDYNNARCILLDQWDDSGSTSASTISDHQPWIDSRLADTNRPRHTLVFAHKCLLGPKNKNNLFGNPVSAADPGDGDGVDAASLHAEQESSLASKQAAENAFIRSLAAHNVFVFICGHDHLHYRSMVTSPDGTATVHQLVGQSASSKFNWPQPPASSHDTPVAQDLNKVGFYICTVDGPRVSIDYYGAPVEARYRFSAQPSASPSGASGKPKNRVIRATPDFTGKWKKLETFGYSLNGRTFLVPQGESYSIVQDNTQKAAAASEAGYLGTEAKIVAGSNGNTATTSLGKALTKVVTTGWSPAASTASDILTLWGTENVGDSRRDTFALCLSFQPAGVSPEKLKAGLVALATRDAEGTWIRAVDANAGGEKKPVVGDYDPRFGLGTYGVNPVTHTAWAIVNYSGVFAVAELPPPPTSDQQAHALQGHRDTRNRFRSGRTRNENRPLYGNGGGVHGVRYGGALVGRLAQWIGSDHRAIGRFGRDSGLSGGRASLLPCRAWSRRGPRAGHR